VSHKQSSLLARIVRARNISTGMFAVVLLGVAGCAVLRDHGHMTPAVYGLILSLLTITGLASAGLWCTVFVCEWLRAEQIGEKVDQLSEVLIVAEYVVAMEDEKYRRAQRVNRN
jgi:hypothetical protein